MARKPNDTRVRVRRVAAKLFESRGYHGTSMDEVAAGVALNKGTLYHYFPGKSDILFEILEETVDAFLGGISEIPPDAAPDDALARLIRFQLHAIASHPREVAVYLQETRWIKAWLSREQYRAIREKEKAFSDYVTSQVQAGLDAGLFSGIDPKVATFSLIGIIAWAYQWYRPKGRLSIDEIAEGMTTMVFQGLARVDELAPTHR